MTQYRFSGHRIIRFPRATRDLLSGIATLLIPRQQTILANWTRLQWNAWQPPGLTRSDFEKVFGDLMDNMLRRLEAKELDECISDLEESGASLAKRRFPFEALIVCIHFFEESYLPYIVTDSPSETRKFLIAIDEFVHAALAAIATSYFDAHRSELLEEAQVGRIVQEGLLPAIPRHTADLEVAHVYTSAGEYARVGGDFLDFFQVGDCAAFIIGDLSGHGVEAASESVVMRSLFKGFMIENPDPADAMRRLNRVMTQELGIDQFATALALCYNNEGCAIVVSAGHPCPFVCNGPECNFTKPTGMALAIDSQAEYTSSAIPFQPGGLFVAYTDGLIDARSHGVFFGEQGLVDAVNDVRDTPARAIAEHLVDSSLRHAGGRFDDDVAVLVIKRRDVAEIDTSATDVDPDEEARAA